MSKHTAVWLSADLASCSEAHIQLAALLVLSGLPPVPCVWVSLMTLKSLKCFVQVFKSEEPNLNNLT